jgi:hypothetical protein
VPWAVAGREKRLAAKARGRRGASSDDDSDQEVDSDEAAEGRDDPFFQHGDDDPFADPFFKARIAAAAWHGARCG